MKERRGEERRREEKRRDKGETGETRSNLPQLQLEKKISHYFIYSYSPKCEAGSEFGIVEGAVPLWPPSF
jgi:hypothetical protein